jgi:hypothetical protein
MNSIARWLKFGGVLAVVLFVGIQGVATVSVSPAQSATEAAKPAPCAAPEYRQFDFWLGDWDAFDFDNPATKVARARVDLILDTCVLLENYEGADGHKGQSFSVYDASRKVWHQSWVTNRGEVLVIEGKFEDGEMVLSGIDHAKAGQPLVRGVWKPMTGGVRETAVTSTDGGKTWQPWFDLVFRPHKP